MKQKGFLGIDIGGSGIKGAPIDIKQANYWMKGIEFPPGFYPENVIKALKALVKQFKWKGPIGVDFLLLCRMAL
jgi:polyphosphate glucokinase